jgi:Tfp pilus assembly protein PilE
MLLPLLASSCGDDSSTNAGTTQAATSQSSSDSAQDRAARLAAQTQLRNAQFDQEAYYTSNESYAATTTELKTENPRLNSKVEVVSGDTYGYEIRIEADDAAHTIFIIRKSGSRTEHIDGNGDSW